MAYDIEVLELEPQPVMVIKAKVAASQLGEELARILPTVHAYITEQGGEMVGMPFMRYLDMGEQLLIDAGIATATAMAGRDEIQSKFLPGGRTATTLYLGEYERTSEAWDAVFAWAAEQNIEQHWGGWNVYENDPSELSDPTQQRTRLYYPLSA
jgi:effector-binding domain-containing protein